MENILSGKMPPEWEGSLDKLEVQIADRDLWPKDATEAERFLDDMSKLVTGLPAWADANYLSRLSLVRWSSLAFNHLNDSQSPDTLLNDLAMAEDVRSLVDAKPAGDASDLDQKLREKANQVENRRQGQVENRQIDKANGQSNTWKRMPILSRAQPRPGLISQVSMNFSGDTRRTIKIRPRSKTFGKG